MCILPEAAGLSRKLQLQEGRASAEAERCWLRAARAYPRKNPSTQPPRTSLKSDPYLVTHWLSRSPLTPRLFLQGAPQPAGSAPSSGVLRMQPGLRSFLNTCRQDIWPRRDPSCPSRLQGAEDHESACLSSGVPLPQLSPTHLQAEQSRGSSLCRISFRFPPPCPGPLATPSSWRFPPACSQTEGLGFLSPDCPSVPFREEAGV